MAVPSQLEDAVADSGDSAFLGQSYLTYIIPFSTSVNIKAEVENAIASSRPLADIESRPWLLFGKKPSWHTAPPLKFSGLTILIPRCQMKPLTSFWYSKPTA